MKEYTIYSSETGLILSNGVCEEKLFGFIVQPGQALIEGIFDSKTKFVKDGIVKDLPEKTSFYLTFSLELEEWIDARTPEEKSSYLLVYKASAYEEVLDVIRQVRAALITNLPGQEMIYLRKEEEAKAYILDPDPDMANYPMMAREIGITAPDAYQLAQVWLFMSSLLMTIAGKLEAIRMSAPELLSVGQTEAEVDQIKETILNQIKP